MWDFRKESTTDSSGANTAAGFIAGYQPFAEADSLQSKRNVVATEKGWVRRITYTDVNNNERVKEEVLIAAHPGGTTGGYANASYLGFPDIATIQVTSPNTATGTFQYAQGSEVKVVVTFNEPMTTSANMTLVMTERDGVTNFTLDSNTTSEGSTATSVYADYVGNNAFVFTGTAPASAGYFKIRAQTVASSALPVSTNFDGETANGVITGAVSNTLLSFSGDVLANGEIQVV